MPHVRISPAWVIASLALFFALGGSAYALGEKASPQPSCAQGAVRGIAVVAGLPSKGIGNLPDTYTANPAVFQRRFNCGGGPIQVRRLSAGVYDVRFAGNRAESAIATAMSTDGASAAVAPQPDGSFEVSISGPAPKSAIFVPEDANFAIVLF